MMSVQMVFGDIKDCADLRCKFFDCLKLKTADLRYCRSIILHLQCFGSIWGSDISDNKNRIFCISHDLTKQCSCRCLTVCSGNCKHSSLTCAISKLDFSPDRKPLLIKALYDRDVSRYTGT